MPAALGSFYGLGTLPRAGIGFIATGADAMAGFSSPVKGPVRRAGAARGGPDCRGAL